MAKPSSAPAPQQDDKNMPYNELNYTGKEVKNIPLVGHGDFWENIRKVGLYCMKTIEEEMMCVIIESSRRLGVKSFLPV